MNDKLEAQGILSDGYGIIPKKIMRDKTLTVEAKAIYAYMCSFAGAGKSAFPSVKLMCAELGMTKDRFYRHRKKLVERGYITIKQTKKGTLFKNNIYTLPQIICSPCPDFTDTEIPYTEIPDTENQDSNINSNNINNNNINSSSSIGATTTAVIQSYTKEISRNGLCCSPVEMNALKNFVEAYGEEQVLKAIEIAVMRNKKSLAYIEGVLKRGDKPFVPKFPQQRNAFDDLDNLINEEQAKEGW